MIVKHVSVHLGESSRDCEDHSNVLLSRVPVGTGQVRCFKQFLVPVPAGTLFLWLHERVFFPFVVSHVQTLLRNVYGIERTLRNFRTVRPVQPVLHVRKETNGRFLKDGREVLYPPRYLCGRRA